ncbi:MAG TPA: hypothetical protein DCM05_11770 [Elusimicrobia bacterium]|nr:hypothetical protein [Elusimicrobiota bacterium]
MRLALLALCLAALPAAAAWECPSPYWDLRIQEIAGFEFNPAHCQAQKRWTETVKVGKDKKVKVRIEGESPSAVKVPGREVEVRFLETLLVGTGKPRDEVASDDNWPCGDRRLKPSPAAEGRHLGFRTERFLCKETTRSGFRRRQILWLDDHDTKMTVLVSYEFSVGLENHQDRSWVARLAKIQEPHQELFEQAITALKPKQGVGSAAPKKEEKTPKKAEPKKESGPVPLLR